MAKWCAGCAGCGGCALCPPNPTCVKCAGCGGCIITPTPDAELAITGVAASAAYKLAGAASAIGLIGW